jgi:Zn finger protein HypA/HybF involved in hydrogenase expression
MPRKRTWKDDEFVEAVRTSDSIRQVLKKLSLNPTGANYKTVHLHVERLRLDTTHWKGKGWLRGKTHTFNGAPLQSILQNGSTYTNTSALKRRLLAAGILKAECAECGISSWRGAPLALVLDHVNGVNDDHRLENLRLLCPNCDSQTPTFAGRNKGTYRGRTHRQTKSVG